jgi:hypothetical protein
VDLEPAELLPTWRNGRAGISGIEKCLDHFLIYEDLLNPSYLVQAWIDLPYIYDHTPICLQFGKINLGSSYPFKFNSAWLQEPAFDQIVRSIWTDSSHSTPGDAQGNLIRKLNCLRANTISWLQRKKAQDTTCLNRLELQISTLLRQKARTDQNVDLEADLHLLEAERACILRADEDRWRLKSRALWLSSGDNNTRFFHQFASHRRNKKFIWDLESEDGSLLNRTEDIKQEAHKHFQSFYQEDMQISLQDQIEIAQLFPQMVTIKEARALNNPCTLEEIHQVLKGFKKEKVPVPMDGLRNSISITSN